MKKALIWICAIVLVFSLVGCGTSLDNENVESGKGEIKNSNIPSTKTTMTRMKINNTGLL